MMKGTSMQQFQEGLFEKELPTIQKNTWYRQRFDACPHFMFFLGDAHTSDIHSSKYPIGQHIAYAGFSKNRADWYHTIQGLKFTAEKIIEISHHNKKVADEMVLEFEKWEKAFYQKCEEIGKMNLSTLNDAELLKQYNELAAIYTKKLNPSPLIDGFALSTDTFIAQKIKTFLISKEMEKKFVEYFTILTAPIFNSFLQVEEIAFLETTSKITQNPSKRKELLSQHQQQFFWIQNNYVKDHVLGIEFFEKRFEQEKGSSNAKRERLLAIPVSNKEKKENLMKELDLPQEIRTLHITDVFNHWQDERKKGTFWATHYFSVLLEEFSKRSGYTMDELKYTFPPEIQKILTKSISKKELLARFEYCMILWVPNQYDVTTDKPLINELDKIGTGEQQSVRELRGFTAQRGKVMGPARIIESAEEVGMVKEGDVLVAVMTRPDYFPAMKKAVAIVTDEGGITCHAAIVARELEKPCIIGTKIATKILKDGDLVEVDATHGVVRKMVLDST